MMPTRRQTVSDFLSKTPIEQFDVSSKHNSVKTMRKVQYQNHIRKLFLEQQHEGAGRMQERKRSKKEARPQTIELIHADWACKLPDLRTKFMPDFETIRKPGFGMIRKSMCRIANINSDILTFRQLHLVEQANHRGCILSQSLPLSSLQWLHSCS